MNDSIQLRRLFREVLAMAPDRHIPETLVFKGVEQLSLDTLKLEEFTKARNWNRAQGFVASRRNEDRDEDEWILTGKGKTKEGL